MKERIRLSGWGSLIETQRPDPGTDDETLGEPGIFARASLRHATRAARLCGLAAEQACAMARCPPEKLASVFSSALGELAITDRICTVLADEPAQLSPVLFHNSVHNAAAAYWSIAARSQNACRAVAAGPFSFATGFLTALGQIQAEPQTPLLYVYYEMPVPERFRLVYGSPGARAVAFILSALDRIGVESGPERLLDYSIEATGPGAGTSPDLHPPWDPFSLVRELDGTSFSRATFPLAKGQVLVLERLRPEPALV